MNTTLSIVYYLTKIKNLLIDNKHYVDYTGSTGKNQHKSYKY